ncbi:diaminopimelate decarboxylase [Sodalis endosymbiont of Henestaris halophilus]|uniref:diaminopimelate decarboxylase n=1 Tax=Sodalis endosymbiont of Henestaris halophilus TaxID=1929246 RepID=UPI000BC06978|nr:diaminopimelate decarboxylase [Sodalis endosymbiont of Henestaris halophilus]SNC58291.1 Diaminopimelate decarboxylase [Sodalis endosymbiont of Henestaris halophilus]
MSHNLYSTERALNAANLLPLHQQYGGPVWVYEAEIISARIAQLCRFDTIRFAQKACSNIHLLRMMRRQGVKVDSVSLGEIERSLLAGFEPGTTSNKIIFTADLLDEPTLKRVIELGIPVNAGSADMLAQLGARAPGHDVWLRINPGFGHGHSKKTNTGGENSKHGIWHEDLPQAVKLIRNYNLHLIGMHMHIGSGVDYFHLAQVCDAMVQQVITSGLDISIISAGGGLSIPYRWGEEAIDTDHYFKMWDAARQRVSEHLGHPVTLETEPGRFLIAEAGVLVTQVRAVKKMGSRHFVLVDAGFNDLMRPAMYGSYHAISLLPADGCDPSTQPLLDTVVGGPLCESGDIFTQTANGVISPRRLPLTKVGDYLVFHDTGAYGASMSSNYNSRPLLPEILFERGKARQIRCRQSLQDLFDLEIKST